MIFLSTISKQRILANNVESFRVIRFWYLLKLIFKIFSVVFYFILFFFLYTLTEARPISSYSTYLKLNLLTYSEINLQGICICVPSRGSQYLSIRQTYRKRKTRYIVFYIKLNNHGKNRNKFFYDVICKFQLAHQLEECHYKISS